MQAIAIRYGINLIFICIISFLIVLSMNPQVLASIPALGNADLQSFKTIFISILLEAFPFILLGVIVSSLMQAFVTERMIAKWIP